MTHLTETNTELSEPDHALSNDEVLGNAYIYRSNEAQNGFTFTVSGLIVASALRSGQQIRTARIVASTPPR